MHDLAAAARSWLYCQQECIVLQLPVLQQDAEAVPECVLWSAVRLAVKPHRVSGLVVAMELLTQVHPELS